ncbi:MAG: DUF4055 domain-containing protein [Pikeienuella sp.]
MKSKVGEKTGAAAALEAHKIRSLYAGTEAMRRAGEKYLPKMPGEEKAEYDSRKAQSWLFNGVRKTVRDMVGRVFDVPVVLAEDAPERLVDWAEDIDLCGQGLNAFAMAVFRDGMIPGISFVMVDAPRREGQVTITRAQSQNLRPYLVHIPVESVLGWKSTSVNNVQTLTQFRFMETVDDDTADEFASDTIPQIRVLDLIGGRVSVRLYRENVKSDWELYDEYQTGFKEITVAPFYANRTGFFDAEPVLEDLADVNIAHWQSQSDQRNILHVARVPILWAAGYEGEGGIKVGTSVAITSSAPEFSLQFAEHSGAAIGAGRQDLKDLEFQMEALGLQLLVQKTPGQSATGEALDAAKETSQLAMMAQNLGDTLSTAAGWMAEYGGLGTSAVTVEVNTEYGAGGINQVELNTLLTSVNTGQISRDTFIGELKRRGVLSAKVDPEDEAEKIDDEGLITDAAA